MRYTRDGRQLTSRNARSAGGSDFCTVDPLLRDDPEICQATLPGRHFSYAPWTLELDFMPEGGLVRCALKTPYRDGTTDVIFEPEDFIARLAALVPKPRAHLIRYHGVFAPASPDRARVVPKTRAAAANHNECGEAVAGHRQRRLSWAQRLKRVFAISTSLRLPESTSSSVGAVAGSCG